MRRSPAWGPPSPLGSRLRGNGCATVSWLGTPQPLGSRLRGKTGADGFPDVGAQTPEHPRPEMIECAPARTHQRALVTPPNYPLITIHYPLSPKEAPMALMVREKLDAKKHVFVDWSLVEPGYAVSWADALGTEWETPQGRPARGREAPRRGRADGRDGAPLGDLLHPAHDDPRRRWPLPPLLHLPQPDGGRRQIGGRAEPLQLLPLLRRVRGRRRVDEADHRDGRLAGHDGEQHRLRHEPRPGPAGADGDGLQRPERAARGAVQDHPPRQAVRRRPVRLRRDLAGRHRLACDRGAGHSRVLQRHADRGALRRGPGGLLRLLPGLDDALLRAGPTDAAPSPTPRRRTSGAGRSRRLSSRPMSTTTPGPTSTRTATPCGPTPTRT